MEHNGRVTGYATIIGFFGHDVGETNADLKALIGAAPVFAASGFLLPTRNSEVFRWCLANGLRVVQPLTLMSRGLYNEPAGAFLPSITYYYLAPWFGCLGNQSGFARIPTAMRTWHLRRELWLPRPRAEVFPFFADAGNLDALTPPWLHFRILTPQPIAMQAGAKIEYQIRIHGVRVRWRTNIAAWEPPDRFVDEQIGGPYRLWVHEHTFEEQDGGTLCRDHVEYAPFGGALVNRCFVERDLDRVFGYRCLRLRVRFG